MCPMCPPLDPPLIYTTFNYLIIIIMTATVLVQLVQQCIVTYVHMLHILHT